jgi:hypothetical protein
MFEKITIEVLLAALVLMIVELPIAIIYLMLILKFR